MLTGRKGKTKLNELIDLGKPLVLAGQCRAMVKKPKEPSRENKKAEIEPRNLFEQGHTKCNITRGEERK